MFFNILIHHRLLPKIKALTRDTRAGVQKCCERLQLGYWGNGTRVKLLHGVRRLVYEARINRSLRLLFTAARMPASRHPYSPENYLLVWDVVTHDNIRRAERLNLEPETGFLDFAEIASAEIDAPPAAPAVRVPESVTDSAELLPALLCAPESPLLNRDEISESIRWFELAPDIITDMAEWQALLEDPDLADLELKLSVEQAQTVCAPGPVLLRGTAGSGKTTVSVYRLARLCVEQRGTHILYVTYSRALLDAVQQLFRDLFRARRLSLPVPGPEFLTFPELYRRLAGTDRGADVRLVRFPLFEKWYRGMFGRNDAALAWEEIRGIIKGACGDGDHDHLSLRVYEELGRKRAPLFVGERPRLFKVFAKYRDWCRQENRCDDIDLARQAVRACRGRLPGGLYDHVVCDEGQDLSEVELGLLLTVCRDWSGLFFTADPQQIVNPSGFRWAEMRSLLRERHPNRPLPEIHGLVHNYRSVQSIVALANALLRVQRERTGRTDDDEFQETRLQGAAPVLVQGAEADVLEYIRGFGPRCAVIAVTEAEAERLGQQLGSERVFSVVGAKGLEFDACVLWNPFSGDVDTWSAILGAEAVPMKEDPGARRAIRHVYVGVTRARRYLGVFEERADAARLWQQAALRAHIEADAPEALAKFMVVAASPGDWSAEGDYFQARSRFRQAAECFRRSGDLRREQENLGLFYESVEDYPRAVQAFRQAGLKPRLAACLERAGEAREAARIFLELAHWPDAGRVLEALREYPQALDAYTRAGDESGQQRCQLALFVARREFLLAAQLAARLGDLAAAVDYYDRAGHRREADELRLQAALAAGDHSTAARLSATLGNLPQAIAEYRAAGDYVAAGQLLEKCGDVRAAAGAFRQAGAKGESAMLRCEALLAEQAGDWGGAEQRWSRLGDTRRAVQCAVRRIEAAGDWRAAAAAYEQRGDTAALVDCLKRAAADPQAAKWLSACEARQDKRRVEAAILFEELERYADADQQAQAFIKQFNDASLGPLTEFQEARQIRERCRMRHLWGSGRRKAAVGLAFDVEGEATVRLHLAFCVDLEDWKRAAVDCVQLKNWADAERYGELAGNRKELARIRALAAEHRGDLATAAEHWDLAGQRRCAYKMRAQAAELAGDWKTAAGWYRKARMTAQARRCLASLTTPVDAPHPRPPRRRPRRKAPGTSQKRLT